MPGYDSTLERVKDNKAAQTVQYKYNVGDTWYIITECSSDSESDLLEVDDMRGQEIWLWKAYENGDTNKMPVVIKGVCLDNGDETEGNIWTLKDMIDEEIHKHHLPTLADDGLAWNSDNVFVSVPPGIANKIVGPEMTKMSSSYANTKSTSRAQAIFVAGENSLFSGGPRPRHEYRFALKEVYTPYFNLTRLKTMFEALRDTIIVLRTVWFKGFTDRDISVANVSWDEKSKCVMLMDLDLLAHADSTMIRRIGTPHFMATELYEGQYLFKAEEDKLPTPEVGLNTQNSKLSFRYNPIHDLESVWWLAVWTLFNHAPKSEVTKPDIKSGGRLMKLYQQKCIYERTFHAKSYWRTEIRSPAFLKPDEFWDLAQDLPELFSSATKCVDIFASCLRAHYGAAESDMATLHENKFETLHQDLIDVVTALLSTMPDELELLPVIEALSLWLPSEFLKSYR